MINGILNIYKEPGFTSHDVVAKLRGITGQKKIGHTGTLDPDAEGVLPVCLGRATKIVELLANDTKTYVATLLLGVTTDTQDVSGKVIERLEPDVREERLRKVVNSFLGEQMQIPPMYSAVKVNGKKLYELARQGVETERVPRPVCFYEIEVLSYENPRVKLRVTCSKGTYIRTLCHDIGAKLSCGGCMEHLLRTRVGRFKQEDAFRLGEVQAAADAQRLGEMITPIDALFEELPAVKLDKTMDAPAYNGNALRLCGNAERIRVYDSKGDFVGLYGRTGREYKVEKMLASPKNENRKAARNSVTIGKFDGIHRGHRKLIQRVREHARKSGASIVYAFEFPGDRKMLLSRAERADLLKEMGIDRLETCLFTEELRKMTPETFVKKVLIEQLRVREVVVGTDFRFGRDRTGTAEMLLRMGGSLGFHVEIMEKEKDGERDISSTYIREELAAGHIEKVNGLLGYNFTISGRIVRGNHLGHRLGFPTINQIPDAEKLLPPNGVYLSNVLVGGTCYQGLTNIGTKPTVNGQTIGVETYLRDCEEDLYGRSARVELLRFLRPEMKFGSLEELKKQIGKDVEAMKYR